jgi:hypothetical protein
MYIQRVPATSSERPHSTVSTFQVLQRPFSPPRPTASSHFLTANARRSTSASQSQFFPPSPASFFFTFPFHSFMVLDGNRTLFLYIRFYCPYHLSRAKNVNGINEGQHILAKNGGTRRFVNLASAFWNWTNVRIHYSRWIASIALGVLHARPETWESSGWMAGFCLGAFL